MGKFVSAAMALLLVAGCAGVGFTSPSSTHPTSAATGAATTTRTPRATPTFVVSARHIPFSGAIEPGRYFIAEGPWTPATLSFTMPAGWVAENGGQTISKHPNESGRETSWSVSIVDRLFADPCGPNDTIDVGPTAADLATALLTLPGPVASGPVDITLGGRPGKRVELTAPPDLDVESCDPPIGLQIWLDRAGNKYLVVGPEALSRIYIADVDRGRLILVANQNVTAAPQDIDEMDAIFASIAFER